MKLYHFTDTARLPWIMRSGELRPGANRLGGFPDPDFLWATIDPNGDRTASANQGEIYKSGKVRLVRFTLDQDAFFPWCEAPARFPAWTEEQVRRLESYARGKSNPKAWWCCDRAIPFEDCLNVETRTYRDNRWQPLDQGVDVVDLPFFDNDRWLAMKIAGTVFISKQSRHWTGADAYEVRTMAA